MQQQVSFELKKQPEHNIGIVFVWFQFWLEMATQGYVEPLLHSGFYMSPSIT